MIVIDATDIENALPGAVLVDKVFFRHFAIQISKVIQELTSIAEWRPATDLTTYIHEGFLFICGRADGDSPRAL